MAGFEGGSRFPFINLEKSIARARELYVADQRGNEMPISGAFAVWKYSDKSSGGFQTVAALKMYGLLEDAGSKDSRKVKLTKHALDFFRDEREEVRGQKLKDFATNPTLFRVLFNRHWGATVPDDAIARSQLKVDGELNEQSARAALSIYKENMAFAKLKGDDRISEIEPEPNVVDDLPEVKIGDYVQWTSNGVDQFKPPRKVVALFPDGLHIQVFGSNEGIPMSEITVVDPPAPAAAGVQPRPQVDANSALNQGANEFNVLQSGGRLQITADVDLEGLQELKEMLDDYESILKRLAARKPK